jgi:hypothetical protein
MNTREISGGQYFDCPHCNATIMVCYSRNVETMIGKHVAEKIDKHGSKWYHPVCHALSMYRVYQQPLDVGWPQNEEELRALITEILNSL